MTSFEKITFAVEELNARNVRKATATPLPYRLLWRLGFAIPPPLFQSFLGLAVFHGLLFGLLLGAILACVDRRLAPDGATVFGTIGGAIFGLVMAAHFRLEARRLELPNWSEYPFGLGDEEEEGW
jgi:Family of unknown function (DUF6404)